MTLNSVRFYQPALPIDPEAQPFVSLAHLFMPYLSISFYNGLREGQGANLREQRGSKLLEEKYVFDLDECSHILETSLDSMGFPKP